MIPLVGLIVAVYAVARLIQVPIEHSNHPREWWLLLVSIPAILVIGVLAVSLLLSGVPNSLANLDTSASPSAASDSAAEVRWRSTLQGYIEGAGEECARVTSAVQAPADGGGNRWRVICQGGDVFYIYFTPGQRPRVEKR